MGRKAKIDDSGLANEIQEALKRNGIKSSSKKKKDIIYAEPNDYLPKEIREKYGLGEFASKTNTSNGCDVDSKE